MDRYQERALVQRIEAARRRIRTLLENTRNPELPSEVPHRYDDKYLLAEILTRVSTASVLQCLALVGVTKEKLAEMRAWAKTRSVTIRLTAHEDCGFLREESRKVESPFEHVTEVRGETNVTRTDKIVTTVTEYFWGFDFEHEIVAFQGTATDRAITLHARKGNVEIKTAAKTTPRPRTVVRPPVDVNVTWLLTHLDAEDRASFTIDRTDKRCHTPRRNEDVEAAMRAFEEIHAWCGEVGAYFTQSLFPAQADHGRDLAAIDDAEVFVPVIPLFEGNAESAGDSGVLPAAYASAFLAEERRSLVDKRRALSAAFPRDATVITAVEAELLVTLLHVRRVCQAFSDGVSYIEGMLRKQLVAAIGKELTPADFSAYMDFHHKKLVAPEYRPLPFSYAIRRPAHDPEGVLAIEAERGGASEAISTTVARRDATGPMSFALDASTRVSFLGERYLHAWISHQFSDQPGPSLSLVARARQFSSFILLVGRIASADVFEPRLGVIVQNKDLLKIPLMLEQIPTPKEFRDAIESLSPEQQRFAKAFRSMQLESTLFGVCVIQIKPQLEKLLKLPPDSLTKEIRLTQDLLGLFIEHQIPSDLVSYDGPPDEKVDEKIGTVRAYVAKMHEMIELSKRRELEEEQAREAMRLAEMNGTPVAGGAFGPPPQGFGPPPPPPRMMAPSPAGAPPPAARSMRTRSAPHVERMRTAAPPPPPAMMAPAPQPAPPPAPAAAPTEKAAAPAPSATRGPEMESAPTNAGDLVDYTRIPGILDKKFEELDEDSALRATIINPGDPWMRTAQKGLLGGSVTSTLSPSEQKAEKNKAFDLLDALSKSGALAIEDASLHVVIAATHGFDRTLLDTVIQDNVNPIEKVERSLMIVGTTIHGRPASELLAEGQRERFFTTSPKLGPAAKPVEEG
jgi:hypothetical protein